MLITSPNPYWRELFEQASPEFDIPQTQALLRAVPEYAELAGFDAAEMQLIRNYIEYCCNYKDLLHVFSLVYHKLFAEKDGNAVSQDAALGIQCGDEFLFNLVLLLSAAPMLKASFAEKGWDMNNFPLALRDCKVWSDHSVHNFGRPGIAPRNSSGEFGWVYYSFVCQILRFHRLQCNIRAAFFDDILVYRNRKTGKVQALMNGEMEFNDKGLYRMGNEPCAFASGPAVLTENTVTGYPVAPDAVVSGKPLTLDLNEWDSALKGGDPIVNLHIPEDGPMRPADCAESVRQMWEFFHTKTDFKVKAVCCESWLLDPQFRHLLPETSNILAFQRAGYLLPERGKSDCFGRVFGHIAKITDPGNAFWKTSMQKTFGEFWKNGGIFRNGRIFLLPEEFPWGSRLY